MHFPSASPAVPQNTVRRCGGSAGRPAVTPRVVLAVDTVGYAVPRTDFSGRVHSVFARACNIARHDTLLTLVSCGAGNGPATLRLSRAASRDLRDLFNVGERVHGRQGCLRTARVELTLQHARIWWPAEPGPGLPWPQVDAHCRRARAKLARRRRLHGSVIDDEGARVVSALRDACRALDRERAVPQVDRLVGWGEGLTPAGDDFLIGLIAGLAARVQGDERRRRFHDALVSAIAERTHRTTPIAAHYLRLAAGGHYTEPLIRARNAMLGEGDSDVVDAALDDALAVGATSGADSVSGLLAGLRSWLPVAAAEAA